MMRDRTRRERRAMRPRRHNERLLLQILRRAGEASKADLTRRTHLTSTAVGTISRSLQDSELVVPTGRRTEGQRGQPASLMKVNAKGAFGIGVRLDRDLIETALVDFDGAILGRRVHSRPLPAPRDTMALVQGDIGALLADLGPAERERVSGIGVARPCKLDAWLRELDLSGRDFAAWQSFDFASALEARTGLPVFSENDGNAAAIAELFFGCGSRFGDFIYLFIGPVIGCGVALDGSCLRGVTGDAGDIAVMPIPPSGLPSAPKPAGKWDMLLSRASLNALSRHLRWRGEELATHVDLEAFVRAGHPAVEEWLADCIDALGLALRSARSILDVPVVVIDADVDAGLIERLVAGLARELEDTAPEARGVPEIVRGSFGSDAGAIGAASLPMFHSFSPRAELLRSAIRQREAAEVVC